MTRLSYSRTGFLRRVQMGQIGLHIIVEGRNCDRVFYDRLCLSSARVRDVQHAVWLVEQTNGGSGGKAAVLSLFEYAKKRYQLRFPPDMGSTRSRSLLFCVDSDIDRLAGGRKRSPHVLYTETADVESEIYTHASAPDAFASALSLDRRTAFALCSALGDWHTEFATHQRPWIELCILASVLSSRVPGVGYGNPSPVHGPKGSGPANAAMVRRYRDLVLKGSAFDPITTRIRSDRAMRRIASWFSSGRGWELVRGRWAPSYLDVRVRAYFGSNPVGYRNFLSKVTTAFLAHVDFNGPWATRYRMQLEALA